MLVEECTSVVMIVECSEPWCIIGLMMVNFKIMEVTFILDVHVIVVTDGSRILGLVYLICFFVNPIG